MLTSINVNLTPELKKIDLYSKRGSAGNLSGSYSSLFKGQGLDFDGYRDYTQQDDAQLIDWKATLRSNNLLIKVFKEERNVNIVYLFDVSASMCFSSHKKLKCEYAAELISSLGYASIDAGDSVGLVMFSDDIKAFLMPNQGSEQYFKLVKMLSSAKNYDGLFDLANCVNFVNNKIPKNSIIIFVSDFIGLPTDWERKISALNYNNEVIAIITRDPRDDFMPAEKIKVVAGDPYSPKQLYVDPNDVAEKYNVAAKQIKSEIKSVLKKRGIDTFEVSTDQPYDKALRNFFYSRSKK
jgi:uncharacterized protein (DUF58 family)